MEEKITQEELKAVADSIAKKNAAKAVSTAAVEKANIDDRIAQLEHQVLVQHIFIKYGLSFNDNIHNETGVITRAKKEVKGE